MTPHSIQQLEQTFGFHFWEDDFMGWTCDLTTYTLLNVDPESESASILTESRNGMEPKWVHTVEGSESQILEDSVRLVLQEHVSQLESDVANLHKIIQG